MNNAASKNRFTRFYHGPIFEDEWPVLDFPKIESACGLTLSEAARPAARRIVAAYIRDCEAAKTIPTREVKAQLRKIVDACRTLEAVLEISDGGLVDEINSKPVLQAAWWHSHVPGIKVDTSYVGGRYPVLADEGDILAYLREWREKAEQAAALRVAGGPSTDEPSRRFLAALHGIYLQSGGQGRGCYPTTHGDAGYAGHFLEFVLLVLGEAGQNAPRQTWAERILDAIPT